MLVKDEIVVTGLGHQHPPHRLDNQFFAELGIDSSAAWVEERTGIKSRYSSLPAELIREVTEGKTTLLELRQAGALPALASMAVKPWELLQQRACFTAEPDLLICSTSSPDYYIPAHASVIAHKLGFQRTIAFDAHSACSSFITLLALARGQMLSQQAETTAIFTIDRYTLSLDFTDRRSCVLFGDGAAAALLEKNPRGKRGLKIIDVLLRSDPSGYESITIPTSGFFSQNGARVQKFAVSKTCEVTEEILEKNKIPLKQVRYFVGHQANLRMLHSVCQRLGFGEDRHLFNVDHYGNQGAAGAPAVLSQHWNSWQAGDYLVVAVVGSGLAWGAALFQAQ